MPDTRTELHGHERQPFPNFHEDATYLERLTVPDHAEAVQILQDEGCDWGEEPQLTAIWMRFGPPETPEQFSGFNNWGTDQTAAWWECPEDHPGAIPFWKDGEPVSESLNNSERS